MQIITSQKRQIYILSLFIGFCWSLWFAHAENVRVGELAWLAWAVSAFISPIVLFSQFYERFFDKSQEESSLRRFVFGIGAFLIGLILSYFVHGILGAFLSVFNEIEPLYYFGKNGYINHFDWPALWSLLKRFELFVPAFILLKTSYLVVTPQARFHGHSVIRDGVLALVFGVLCVFLEIHVSADNARFIFCLGVFAPWPLIIGRDIIAKKRDKVADLSPDIKIPALFIDQGSLLWGLFIITFGLLFLVLGTFPIFLFAKNVTISALAIGTVFFLAFGGFASLAIYFGLNLAFAYKRVEINNGYVKIQSREFRPLPLTKDYHERLSLYEIRKKSILHTDSDGPDYTEYLVELVYTKDEFKNVTLYRAYHEDGWDQKFSGWKELLKK